MEPIEAWALIVIWILLPTLYIALFSGRGGWTAPKTSKCPFGPKVGWILISCFLGLIGLFLFFRSQRNRSKKNNT